MQIIRLGACRSKNGKIYIKLLIKNSVPHAVIRIIQPTGNLDGNLPCELFELKADYKKELYVLVAPIVSNQAIGTCTLAAFNDDLDLVDTASYVIDFEETKWESRKNRLLRRELIQEIERYDETHSQRDSVTLSVVRAVNSPSHIIVEFMISLPYASSTVLSVVAFDQNIHPLEQPLFMGTSKEPTQVADTVFRFEAVYSVTIPWNQKSIYVVAKDTSRPYFQKAFHVSRAQIDSGIMASNAMFLDAGNDPYYAEWFKHHRISDEDLTAQRDVMPSGNPLFSMIVLLHKAPTSHFETMLRSLLDQSYQNWELLLIFSGSDETDLINRINSLSSNDRRIQLITLNSNDPGLAFSIKMGLNTSAGDFISFFDQNDVLEPNLLFEFANAIGNQPNIDLLYCDNDLIGLDGNLHTPYFKPNFDIDLLRGQNYIRYMLTIRKPLLKRLELSDTLQEEIFYHDIALQAVEKASLVWHVPSVLYHHRAVCDTPSDNAYLEACASEAGIEAVKAHLQRLGEKAEVSPGRHALSYTINYLPPEDTPLVSIIIPTQDHSEVLSRCITSILEKTTYTNYEIVLIDNNSTEETTFQYYERVVSLHKQIRLESYDGPFNFSNIINFGAAVSQGDFLLLLNNDTEVITPQWITRLVGICSRSDVGCAGVRLFYPNDTLQHAGVVINYPRADHYGVHMPRGSWGYQKLFDRQRELSAVTAACMMTSRTAFNLVGGFEKQLAVSYNDIDYCLKLREHDLLVVYTPEVELYHYESLSRGHDRDEAGHIRLVKETGILLERHPEIFGKGDPYFTPNIAPDSPYKINYYHF